MNGGYTKLFSTITASTVWQEPHATRIVWVTMLAMCDAKGRVMASIPGLANIARVTLQECVDAIDRFKQPDQWSRTKVNDGRRIEEVEGGWRLLNYDYYRQARDADDRRDYQREWDRTHRSRSTTVPTNSDKTRPTRPNPTQAEAEAEAKKKEKKAPDGASDQDGTIWKLGLGLLTKAGQTERSARTFLGKHARNGHAPKLAEVIAHMSLHPVADPVAYIEGAMRDKAMAHVRTLADHEVD